MVRNQIAARGVRDPAVLNAMRRAPRHRFVPAEYLDLAYDDRPLPIGFDQTISQPFIVGYMTQALRLDPEDRVLEVGSGSGYQTAILAEIAREVLSIEIVPQHARRAGRILSGLGYENIRLMAADGHQGWPRAAPFQATILTAAPREIPEPLVEQLAEGGRIVGPVGGAVEQVVHRWEKKLGKVSVEPLIAVRFVPMTGNIS